MVTLAVIAAIAAFLVVGWFVGAGSHNIGAGFVSGCVAAIWTAWPLVKVHQQERSNMLSPVPKRYQAPCKQAFAALREILATSTYEFGNTWRVSLADTQTKRIVAMLSFSEDETRLETGSRGGIDTRTYRVKRLINLEAQFKDDSETCVIQLDFDTKAEGHNWIYACDHVIHGIQNALDDRLGIGRPVGSPATFTLTAPPWWLLGLTGLGVLILFAMHGVTDSSHDSSGYQDQSSTGSDSSTNTGSTTSQDSSTSAPASTSNEPVSNPYNDRPDMAVKDFLQHPDTAPNGQSSVTQPPDPPSPYHYSPEMNTHTVTTYPPDELRSRLADSETKLSDVKNQLNAAPNDAAGRPKITRLLEEERDLSDRIKIYKGDLLLWGINKP